jgi:hypothetical protein
VKLKLVTVGAVFSAFMVSGPLQYFGLLPQTPVGDASKGVIKAALNLGSAPAFASCSGGGHSVGGGPQGNNGFGNGGGDGVPGNSGSAPGCDGCAADQNR